MYIEGSPLSDIVDLSRFWLFCSGSLALLLLTILNHLASTYLAFNVSNEGCSRDVSCALNLIYSFSLPSLDRYLCWWTISPTGVQSTQQSMFRHLHGLLDITGGLLVSGGYHQPSSPCFGTDRVYQILLGDYQSQEDIIRPVVRVSALTGFIRYYWGTISLRRISSAQQSVFRH